MKFRTLSRLLNRQALDTNIITKRMLNCGRKTITYISFIFNGCARLHYFLSKWKNAIEIMLPRPGKDLK